MPSFDIVSEIDATEIRNAQENASRELETRFDFRGVEAQFALVGDDIKMTAEADFQLNQMLDILRGKLAKRQVDTSAMDLADPIPSGKTVSQLVCFKQGIDTGTAKLLVKHIKQSKLKVQASIQGEQVRVTGKKRDDLQSVMTIIREADLGQPFQFTNFRD